MQSRICFVLLFAALGVSSSVGHAQSPQRIGDGLCDVRKLPPRDYTECLRKAQDESERTLRDRVSAVGTTIEKAQGLSAAQKTRWKKAVDDGQGLWIRFRNAECQDLTLFETANKNRIAEEQRICILEYNNRRLGELNQRYPG